VLCALNCSCCTSACCCGARSARPQRLGSCAASFGILGSGGVRTGICCCTLISLTAYTTFVFQVPESLKNGLKNQRLSNLRAGAKTQEQVQDRLELVAAGGYGEHFAPYSDAAMDAALARSLTGVEAILAETLVRFCFIPSHTLFTINTSMAGVCWLHDKKRRRLRR
jgi:hypothetical protein